MNNNTVSRTEATNRAMHSPTAVPVEEKGEGGRKGMFFGIPGGFAFRPKAGEEGAGRVEKAPCFSRRKPSPASFARTIGFIVKPDALRGDFI